MQLLTVSILAVDVDPRFAPVARRRSRRGMSGLLCLCGWQIRSRGKEEKPDFAEEYGMDK
jgi:hypothetical protein